MEDFQSEFDFKIYLLIFKKHVVLVFPHRTYFLLGYLK